MHNRTAWIALLGCGLLCYAIFVLSLTIEAGDAGHWKRVSSNLSTIDRTARSCSLVEHQNAPRVVVANSQTPAVPIAYSVSGQIVAKSAHEKSSSRPVTQFKLVAYTEDQLDGDRTDQRSSEYWPVANVLVEQIKMLQNEPEVQAWSEQTIILLESMSQADPNSRQLDNCLEHLEIQLQAVPDLAAAIGKRGDNSIETIYAHCEVSRLAYRLQRRIAIWKTIRNASRYSGSQIGGVFHSFGSNSTITSASFSRINFESLDPNWVEYLKLHELRATFGSLNPNAAEQKKVARSVLARIYSPVLKPDQATYIQQIIDPMIVSALKQHATGPFDATELLKRIEKYESQSSSLSGYYLNEQYQNLLWSTSQADQVLASEIQKHYRNANFRFVVSEKFLNRLIPDLPTTASPVSENIKGARVSGQSQVSNRLRVELIPNPNQIQLKLVATGDVKSETIAKTKSFRIQNVGKARFHVVQQVTISPQGIEATSRPQARSKANQYVVGLESKMDNFPVAGWMARKLAAKKLREEAPETDRMFKRTVESSAENQMQQQVNEQLAKLRQLTYTKLFQPLLAMDLEPESLQMATTDKQVVMRYRLAGQDQMAANTSRPRDSGQSLLSFQLHQSAINNAIARIGLNGNRFTIDELEKHLRDVVGLSQLDSSEQKTNQYAEIGFAYFDPIRVDFQDDRLKITLNLKSLKIGENGKVWKNVSLTAAYRFALDGMNIQLQQDDDGTRIKGKRLRFTDRAAISTVMKVMFKQQYSMNSLPRKLSERINSEFLEVSQLVASDGWLAVSIDDRQTSTAQNNQGDHRTGAIRKLLNRR